MSQKQKLVTTLTSVLHGIDEVTSFARAHGPEVMHAAAMGARLGADVAAAGGFKRYALSKIPGLINRVAAEALTGDQPPAPAIKVKVDVIDVEYREGPPRARRSR